MPETGPQPGATAIIDRETAADEADFIEADDLYGDEETTASPVNEFTVMTEPDPDDFGSEKESEPDNHTSAEYELRDGELYPSASNEDDGTQAGLAISHWMNEAQHAEYQEAIATAMDGGEGLIETLSPVGHTDDTEQFVVMTYRFVRFTDDGTPVIEISSHTIDRPRETPLQLEDQDQINDDYITNEVDEASLDEAAVTPSLEPRPFDQDTPISEATTNASTPSDEPGQSEIIESTATVPESTATTPESPEAEAGTNITRSEYILRNETLTPAKAGEDGTDATLDVAHWMNPEQRTIHEEALSQALNGGEGIMEMRGVIGHTDTEEVFVVATYRHVRNDADGSPVIEVTSMDVKRPVSTPPEEAGIPEPEAQHDGDEDSDTADDSSETSAAEPTIMAQSTPIQSETIPTADTTETKAAGPSRTETEAQPGSIKSEDEQDAAAATVPIQPATTSAPPDAPGGGTLTAPAEQTPVVAEGQPNAAESGDEAADETHPAATDPVIQVATATNPAPVIQAETAAPSAEQATTQTVDTESTLEDGSEVAETDVPAQVAVAPAAQTTESTPVSAPAPAAQAETAQTQEASPATPPIEQTATQVENVKDTHNDKNDAEEAATSVQAAVTPAAQTAPPAVENTPAPPAQSETRAPSVEQTSSHTEDVEGTLDDEAGVDEADAPVQTVVATSPILAAQPAAAPSTPEQTITKTDATAIVSPSNPSQEAVAENNDDTKPDIAKTSAVIETNTINEKQVDAAQLATPETVKTDPILETSAVSESHDDTADAEATFEDDTIDADLPVKAITPMQPTKVAETTSTPNAPEQPPVTADAVIETNIVDNKTDVTPGIAKTSPRIETNTVSEDDDTPAQTEADTSEQVKATILAEPTTASDKQDTETDPPTQVAASANPTPVIQASITPATAEQITDIPLDDRLDTIPAIPVEGSVRTDTPAETGTSVEPAILAEKAPTLNTPERPPVASDTVVETTDEDTAEVDTPIAQTVVTPAAIDKDKDDTFNEATTSDMDMIDTQTEVAGPSNTATITEAPPATPVAEQIAAAESAPIAPLAAEAVLTAPAETAAGKVQVEENGSNRAEDDPAEEAAMEPVKSKVVTTAPPTTIEGDWLADFGAAPAETTTDDSWRDELKQPGIMTGPTLETTRNRTTISISDDTDEDDIVINFGAKPSSGRTRHRHNAGSVAA